MSNVSRLGGVVLLSGMAASCSDASPSATAPAAISIAAGGTASSIDAEFPLLDGTFTIASRGGDGIAGVYSGVARSHLAGDESSSLTLVVSSGTGAFGGASGTLALVGVGAETGEGEFLLEGGGELRLSGGRQVAVALTLRGRSGATCSPSARIAISQIADGTMRRAGRVEARLAHEVANTGCET